MSSSPRLRVPDPAGIAAAARALEQGRLVAFPTETVYGLGADAFAADAVTRIFAAKGRPADNPVIVHVADVAVFDRVAARVPPLARSLAAAFLPGPLTLVLDARAEVPRVTTGGLATVALRVPEHPVASALLAATSCPVAAPSANRSGRPSPTTAAHVAAELGSDVDLVLDGGPCPLGVESTVVDARGHRPVVLREGSITREMLGLEGTPDEVGDLAASPGTRYRHYAPSCRVIVAPTGRAATLAARLRDAGEQVALLSTVAAPPDVVEVGRFADPAQLAQQLYAALRRAEEADVAVLVVEEVAPVGVGRAVMDRIRRAADTATLPR